MGRSSQVATPLNPKAFGGRDFTFVQHGGRDYLVLHTEQRLLGPTARAERPVAGARQVDGVYVWAATPVLEPVRKLSPGLQLAVSRTVQERRRNTTAVNLKAVTWPRVSLLLEERGGPARIQPRR
jgi:hypothetical protein